MNTNNNDSTGSFQRKVSRFRNWITADASPGPTGRGGFSPNKNRYHLYVSYACPWANRTLIMRALKGLEDFISVSVVHWRMGENGWAFKAENGAQEDPLMEAQYLRDIYRKVDPDYNGVVSVPLLWDKQENIIVNNESSEIIRMFNSAFNKVGALEGDYYPEALRTEINIVNERVYETVNNGVYRVGFATTQEAYETAFHKLFDTLDWLEERLANQEYLVGNQLTEADIRLFVTLIRFDAVYFGHFKCNYKQIRDYPALWLYTRKLYAHPEIKNTINFFHIKHHYYESHLKINPTGIVPLGPEIDFSL